MKKFYRIIIISLVFCCYSCCHTASEVENDHIEAEFLTDLDNSSTPFVTNSGAPTEIVDSPSGKGKAMRLNRGYVCWNNVNQDWSNFDYVKADIYLDSDQPCGLYIELRDKDTFDYWTRINIDTVLLPGENIVKAELNTRVGGKSRPGRVFQKEAVNRLVYSLDANKPSDNPPYIYIRNVRLEKDDGDRYFFDGLRAFSFGPEFAPLMRGFNLVDAKTFYTPELGYGFTPGVNLRAEDAFQPDSLYRSMVLVNNCDFIVDLPNGQYRVFMNIDGPGGYWGQVPIYRNRRVFINSEEVLHQTMDMQKAVEIYFRDAKSEDNYNDDTFAKYIDPLFNEPIFDAEVTDGKLVISFQHDGESWGIPLSTIIIYPADKESEAGKFFQNLHRKRKRDFEEYSHKTLHKDDKPEPKLSSRQKKQGFIFFTRPFEENIYPNTKPLASDIIDKIQVSGASGVMLPANFAVRAYKDLKSVKVSATELKSPNGATIPAEAVNIRYVSNRIQRIGWDGNWYTIAPMYVMNESIASIDKNFNRYFWVNVEVPANTPKGVYLGKFLVEFGNGAKAELPLEVEIVYDGPLPSLDVPMGPWGSSIYVPWFQDEIRPFADFLKQKSLEYFQKYGLTHFSGGAKVNLSGKGKELKLDLSEIDKLMNEAKKHGLLMFGLGGRLGSLNIYGYSKPTNPVELGFENADEMWAHVIGELDKHSRENDWLPIFFNSANEPHIKGDKLLNTETNRILKKYATDRIRFAGAYSITKARENDQISKDLIASYDVANMTAFDQWAIDFVHANGGDWAAYNHDSRWAFGVYSFMLRQKNKMLFRLGWNWNDATGNPYYALDCREDDFAWVNTDAEGNFVTTILFEQIYQGIVDYRYLLTLKNYAEANPETELGKKAQELIDEVFAIKVPTKKSDRAEEFRVKALEILRNIK